jgi:A/G-specific adenine glycosylase
MAVRKEVNSQEISKILLKWGKINYRNYPWRNTGNSYHALIAEIMLQRTKAEQVLSVYEAFSSRYSKPEEVCSDDFRKISLILKPLGLHWRAKLVVELSNRILEIGTIPNSFNELIELPAIGQYAASAYLSLHRNQRYPLIDANTVRVWGRIFGFKTDAETRRVKWFKELVEDLTPLQDYRDFNYAILDFSALVCGKKPMCENCALNEKCLFYLRNIKKA